MWCRGWNIGECNVRIILFENRKKNKFIIILLSEHLMVYISIDYITMSTMKLIENIL